MTVWPTLLREKVALSEGDLTIDLLVLLERAHKVKVALYEIGLELDALIKTHQLSRPIAPTCLSALVSEMHEFKDTMTALLLCYHAMYSIIILRIISSLVDSLSYQVQLELEIFHLCKRIWMLVEHGLQTLPLGLPILQCGLMMTVESADWEAQGQIVEIMNKLERFREPGRNSWTREVLIYKAMVYRGDRTD